MRIKNSEAVPEKAPEIKPVQDDTSARALAAALLAQSENSLEIISTLIKSQRLLESHAIVLDRLVEEAKAPRPPLVKRKIKIRVTDFDNFGRPTDYILSEE